MIFPIFFRPRRSRAKLEKPLSHTHKGERGESGLTLLLGAALEMEFLTHSLASMCDFKVTAAVWISLFIASPQHKQTWRLRLNLCSADAISTLALRGRARRSFSLVAAARRSTEMKIKDCPLEIHGTISNLSYYRSAGRNFYKRFPISIESKLKKLCECVSACHSPSSFFSTLPHQ